MGDYEAVVVMIRKHLDEADFEAQPEERVERACACSLCRRYRLTRRCRLTAE
jgi:hypothetical protein